MPIQIVRNDITKMNVDAVVNAANNELRPGGGVCGAIHSAAGPELAKECRSIGFCDTGDAKATGAYNLRAQYVIHTVGPVWHGGDMGEREALASCYKKSLELAKSLGCETMAFPLISSGIFGYPKKEALQVAMETICDFLLNNEMTVYLALFNKECLNVSKSLFSDIEEYIDQNYVDEQEHLEVNRSRLVESFSLREITAPSKKNAADEKAICESASALPAEHSACESSLAEYTMDGNLDDWLTKIDESFSEMVLRKIKEKGMTNAQCYKKANIDKKLFSKIKSSRDYKPKKNNALALAIALELSIDETRELRLKAGMALSHSSKFDIIVEYFIVHGKYDIFEINEVLFNYDQPLLGGAIY